MILEIEGLPIYYHEIGTGEPILILHGWGGNAQWMSYLMERMVKWPDEFRRIYVELPGHGRTPLSANVQTSDDILRIIDEFTQEFFSGSNFLLIGLSYGAYIARGLIYKSAHRIEGVCMLVPLIVPDDSKRSLAALEVFEYKSSLSHLIPHNNKEFFDLLAVRNEQTLRQLSEFLKAFDETLAIKKIREEMRSDPSRFSLSFEVDNLKAPYPRPSLIVTARQDNVVGYEDAWSIMRNYPRATFVVLDRTGHLLEGQEGNLSQLIRDWLVRVKKF